MLKADKSFIANGIKINQYFLHNHNINKIDLPIAKIDKLIGVTIHNTDDLTNVEDDAEQYTRATVNGNMKGVRVHYYVDDLGAWQNLDECYTSWHAADGNGNGNMRTISIECIMTGKNQVQDLKAKDNASRLISWILSRYGLTEKNLYTHTHWLNVRDKIQGTREFLNTKPNPYKCCPLYILPKWNEFEQSVGKYILQLKPSSQVIPPVKPQPKPIPQVATKSFVVKIICDELNVRNIAGFDSTIVTVVKKNEAYTIVDTQTVDDVNWGKLKSGIGWIGLGEKYVKKI